MHQLFCKSIEKERDYDKYRHNKNYFNQFSSINNKFKTPLNFRE